MSKRQFYYYKMNLRLPIQAPNPIKTRTISKQEAPKIQTIQDKKLQKNSSISYLVVYEEADHPIWASKNYLQSNLQNNPIIEQYESQKQAASKGMLKRAEKRKSGIEQQKNQKPISSSLQNTEKISMYERYAKKLQSLKAQNKQAAQMSTIKKKKQIQKQIHKQKKQSKIQKKKIKSAQNNETVQKQQFKQKQKKVGIDLIDEKIKFSNEFEIKRAKINQENGIQFQIMYENGMCVWVQSDKLKNQHPQKVIKFYQKKISWGC